MAQYENYKKLFDLKIINDEKKQNEMLEMEKLKNITNIKNLEKGFHNRMTESDLQQIDQWKKNMEIKRKFEIRLSNELNREANYFKRIVLKSINDSETENKMQIENFEKNLSRLGLDVNNMDPKLKKPQKAQPSSEIILQKIREKIQANATAKKERDRRKRKIQIEQKKAQEELKKMDKKTLQEDAASGEEQVEKNKIVQKKISEYKNWKELHNIDHESIIKKQKEKELFENEKNKNYDEIFKTTENNNNNNEGYINTQQTPVFDKKAFIENLWKQDSKSMQKQTELRHTKRERNIPIIKKITDSILDLVDEVYKHQKNTNTELLDQELWKELTKTFVNSPYYLINSTACNKISQSYFDLIEKKSEIPDNISRLKINDSLDIETLYNQIVDGIFEDCELFDYLNFIGQYKSNVVIPNNVLNSMLDIFEIVGIDLLKQIHGSKYGSMGIDSLKDYEPKDEDIENLTIPKVYEKNFNLSEILNILVDIKYADNNINNSADILNNTNLNNINQNIISPYANANTNTINTNQNYILNTNNANNNLNITNQSITNNNVTTRAANHKANNISMQSNPENSNNNINNNNKDATISSTGNNMNKNSNFLSIWNSIPLKILFFGKKFSGRKTQVKALCENFPLKLYSIEEAIQKHIETFERLEIPIEQNSKYKSMKKNELEKLLAEREIEEKKFEPLKGYAIQLREYKNKKEKIPETFLFEFLIELIKQDFPEKTQSQLIDEINLKNKKKKELQEELNKLKEEKTNKNPGKNSAIKNESFYINELQKLSIDSNKGIVLVDFPGNVQQAKFFEHKINNFISDIERPKTFTAQLKENYHMILDKVTKPDTSKALVQGAFNLIFYMEVSNQESLRRAKNRKIDPNTGIIYHLEDNPPPLEDKKLTERLLNYEENLDYDDLQKQNKILESEMLMLEEFYNVFGFQKNNLKIFNKFNFQNFASHQITRSNNNTPNQLPSEPKAAANKDPAHSLKHHNKKDLKELINSISSEMSQVINQVIKINEEKEAEFIANMKMAAAAGGNNNIISTKDAFNNTIISSSNTNNNMNNNNPSVKDANSVVSNNIQTKDFQKPKEPLNQNNPNIINNTNNDKNNIKAEDEFTSNNNNSLLNQLRSKSILQTKNNIYFQNNLNNNNNANVAGINFNNQKIQNLDEEDFNKYHKKLEEAKRKLASFTIDTIYNSWSKMYEKYISNTKIFFKNLRKQKESIIFNYNKIQERFIEFLRRPSRKMVEINKFQKKYNKFFDEYPQLRGDEAVKQEFHHDLSDFSDRIWEVIEERKVEAIEERKKIMDNGYIQNEMEKFYGYLEKLFFLEVEKFVSNLNVLRDFYYSMDYRFFNQDGAYNFNPQEILKEGDLSSLPLFGDSQEDSNKNKNSYSQADDINSENKTKLTAFPRIEKLYKNAIRLVFKFDEILKSFEKITKNNAMNNISHESSIKKATKNYMRKIHDNTFVDDKREIFLYDEELKSSIKLEKDKYKFRITFLKFWAVDYLGNIRKISKLVYDKLDDWIITTIKTENDAMNNLLAVFDGCIEKEMRLRIDFEMDSFDIYKLIDINDHIEILVILF